MGRSEAMEQRGESNIHEPREFGARTRNLRGHLRAEDHALTLVLVTEGRNHGRRLFRRCQRGMCFCDVSTSADLRSSPIGSPRNILKLESEVEQRGKAEHGPLPANHRAEGCQHPISAPLILERLPASNPAAPFEKMVDPDTCPHLHVTHSGSNTHM